MYGNQIAVKFGLSQFNTIFKESFIFNELNANYNNENITIEEYGIPAVYIIGWAFREFSIPVIGMTLCEKTIQKALYKKNEPQTELNFLCALYQAVSEAHFKMSNKKSIIIDIVFHSMIFIVES